MSNIWRDGKLVQPRDASDYALGPDASPLRAYLKTHVKNKPRKTKAQRLFLKSAIKDQQQGKHAKPTVIHVTKEYVSELVGVSRKHLELVPKRKRVAVIPSDHAGHNVHSVTFKGTHPRYREPMRVRSWDDNAFRVPRSHDIKLCKCSDCKIARQKHRS